MLPNRSLATARIHACRACGLLLPFVCSMACGRAESDDSRAGAGGTFGSGGGTSERASSGGSIQIVGGPTAGGQVTRTALHTERQASGGTTADDTATSAKRAHGGTASSGSPGSIGGGSSSPFGSAASIHGTGGTSGLSVGSSGRSSTGGTSAAEIRSGTTSNPQGGSNSNQSSALGTQPKIVLYIAGDSTVANYTDTAATNDQAGWGQMLSEHFNKNVAFVNRSAGGRTAYWFYLEGALDAILSKMVAGDYLFIQFGTNDQNKTATFEVDGKTYPRLADTETFKKQLKQYYLDPTKAKGGIPVLVTPPPRNSAYCNGGNGLGAYATAMIELGNAEGVAVLDNNARTFEYLKAICPQPTTAAQETFFFGKADGTIDGTHFQENGARKMAGFIAKELEATALGLKAYLL